MAALDACRPKSVRVLKAGSDTPFSRSSLYNVTVSKGVLYATLQDESGSVNVIVWLSLLKRYRKEALSATLLGVKDVWQTDGKVKHLVARRLFDITALLGDLITTSRNFC